MHRAILKRAQPLSRVTVIQAGRFGARRRVIRAIQLIVNFIVTLVSTFQWSIWGELHAGRENSPA